MYYLVKLTDQKMLYRLAYLIKFIGVVFDFWEGGGLIQNR